LRFVNIQDGPATTPAVVRDDRAVPLSSVFASMGRTAPATMTELIAGGNDTLAEIEAHVDAASEAARDLASVRLGPCVSDPEKILCVGLNYRAHAIESGMAIPEHPVLFSKFNNALAAPGDAVDITGLVKVDYESELAVVIGRTTKNVSVDDALDAVFGYCNANDLSEREMQLRTGQWLLGKTIDGFLPIGPYLVTRDEVPDPQDLPVKGWLNGELRQDSTTADMIFTVAEIISYASRVMTLKPGDVIITGTPFGVIMGMETPVWMQSGDEYTVQVGDFGRLSNRIA